MRCIGFKPSCKALLLVVGLLLISIVSGFLSTGEGIAVVGLNLLLLIVLAVFLIDFYAARIAPDVSLKLLIPGQLSFNRWQQANLKIKNQVNRSISLCATAHINNDFEIKGLDKAFNLDSNEELVVGFKVKGAKRGDAQVGPLEMCMSSKWGFWRHYWLFDEALLVKVYPDFSRLSQSQSLKGLSNLPINGLKQQKKRGSGLEFHQLREFCQGDSVRQIDWQASSKQHKLIAREYQEEQNQHVIVMLDASNAMNIKTQTGTHFDAALNALLLLSHSVLKQGDWFSMHSFNQHERWLPAIKGAQNVSKVMNHFYDLDADSSASDYLQAVTSLLNKRSKRALVLLVTTLDDQNSDNLLFALKKLQAHHLVALVNIENVGVSKVINDPIKSIEEADSYCAAIDLRNHYSANTKRMIKEGIICVEAKPEHLLPHVLNTYLNVKHSGML